MELLTPEEFAEVSCYSFMLSEFVLSESFMNTDSDANFESYVKNNFDEVVVYGSCCWYSFFGPMVWNPLTEEKLPNFVARMDRFLTVYQWRFEFLHKRLQEKKIRRLPQFKYNRSKGSWSLYYTQFAHMKESSISADYSWNEDSNDEMRELFSQVEGRSSKPDKLKHSSGMSAHHVISFELLKYIHNAHVMCNENLSDPEWRRLYLLKKRNDQKLHISKFWLFPSLYDKQDKKRSGDENDDSRSAERSRGPPPQKLPENFAYYASYQNFKEWLDETMSWSPEGAVIMMGPGNADRWRRFVEEVSVTNKNNNFISKTKYIVDEIMLQYACRRLKMGKLGVPFSSQTVEIGKNILEPVRELVRRWCSKSF